MPTYPGGIDHFQDLLNAFEWVRNLGPVKAISGGPHSVGTTLETLLNHPLDADTASDFGFTEIKAQRHGTSSPTTLFTKEPTYNQGWSMGRIVREHGYIDSEGCKALRINLYTHENHGLRLNAEGDYLNLYSVKLDEEIGFWQMDDFEAGLSKISDICYITADVDFDADGDETFHYQSFSRIKLPEDFNADSFLNLIHEGSISIEIRTYIRHTGKVRNHGTAFRSPNIYGISLYDWENLL